ncbi:tripartite tricarboxylate transporter permease [Azospirillum sp.]|uniref:tripartite tricarboxylate transporter permease n=1 Tax=Azospirillum sp. TaxID=34012 RepID=UPI002D2F4735|nr:tripartite tricarboxylate transporter permease [Azospirillum sp.]HYD70237.1 tripartite tricarboxylate transporter permease [Azospirillum sp.]
MDLLANLALGIGVAFTPANLGFCLAGALLGTLIGVLPGLGPVATVALLLPITFTLPPVGALIMLAGIYYGAQYGGSTSAILVNLPGESSSVITCLDGYQMARQGRAGQALAIAAIGSFFAGTVMTLAIALFGPLLTALAKQFGSAEYFALMTLGLVATIVLASGSVLKAVGMIFLGLLLGMVGTDVNSGAQRFTFGVAELSDGIGFVPLAMGLFGLSEVIYNLERPERRDVLSGKLTGLMPSWRDLKACFPPILRGTAIGGVLGVLPGGGAVLSSFAAYTIEKRIARDPSRFGRGAIEGVAAPEAANNAGAQASFIPLLTLGIPANPVMALMVGAMMIQGIAPGPQVMSTQPDLFWGMIASMWAGNLMLIVINLPMIGLWVRLLRVPYRLLFPAILTFCAIGVYSLNNSLFEVALMALFGLAGYLFLKLECEPAPLLLGFVLGPMMEENLRRALLLSRGDPMVFAHRPISAGLLALAAVILVVAVLPAIRRKRQDVFVE